MQVWARGWAGRPDLADHRAGGDRSRLARLDPPQVRVTRHHAAAVIDIDDVSIAAVPTAERHYTVTRCDHRCARVTAEVSAAVKAARMADRIVAPAEARRLRARDWLWRQHGEIRDRLAGLVDQRGQAQLGVVQPVAQIVLPAHQLLDHRVGAWNIERSEEHTP